MGEGCGDILSPLFVTMNHIILRNTAVRGFEPLISKVTISRLNQLSHTTWEAIASTLSVGLFLGNETHHANSKREGCGGAQCPHRAPPQHKKLVKRSIENGQDLSDLCERSDEPFLQVHERKEWQPYFLYETGHGHQI